MAAIKTIFSNTKYRIGASLAVLMFLAYAFIAKAELEECGQVLCLPEIIQGNVIDDQYFSGEIDLGTLYQAGKLYETEASAFYTLNANSANPTWLPAEFHNTVDMVAPMTPNGRIAENSIPNILFFKPLNNGRSVIVHSEVDDPTSYSLTYFRIYDDSFSPITDFVFLDVQGGPFGVNTVTGTVQDVIELSDGRIAFLVLRNSGTPPVQLSRYVQIFQQDGTPATDKVFIPNTHFAYGADARLVAFTAASNSEFEAVIDEFQSTSNPRYVTRISFNSNGVAGTPLRMTAGCAGAAILVNGSLLCTYTISDKAHFRIYNSSGQSVVNDVRFSVGSGDPEEDPLSVVGLANGEFVGVWRGSADTSNQVVREFDLLGQRFTAVGARLGSQFLIDSLEEVVFPPPISAKLVPMQNAEFGVMWQYFTTLPGEPSDRHGRLRLYNGSAAGPIINLGDFDSFGFFAGPFWRIDSSADGALATALRMRFHTDLSYISLNKPLLVNNISPQQNIDVQFKVQRPSQPDIFSPIRSYLYGDVNAGQGGSIGYPNGYTNQVQVSVTLSLPNPSSGLYESVQLYQRTAPLSSDSCGTFSGWSAFGSQSSLTQVEQAPVADNLCYQYKWTVTNIFENSFDYTSTNIVKVDRTPPIINIASQQVVLGELQLTLAIDEPISAIASRSYRLNSQAPVSFSGLVLNLEVLDGGNRVDLAATDLAGNTANRVFNVVADLTPPDILIHGLVDGGVYGGDVPLDFTLTQPLTNLEILVNGQPRSDLVGLPNGQHTVTIRGLDAQGNLVSKTITITIDNSVLSLTLLSPQARTYQQNTVTIAYQSSQPLTSVSYSLNNGPAQQGTVLAELADGTYNLTVTGVAGGNNVSASVQFTVQEGIPTLSVESPLPGAVLPSNGVTVTYDSNSPVTYEVAGMSGNLASGQTLILPEAGEHVLTLTATHPVSGNVVRQQIAFTTDPVAPSIELQSPRAQLYSFREIPIQYTPNKLLKNVVTTLNGAPVSVLKNLPSGNHQFVLTAEDFAGRAVQKTVNFTVSYLDIVTPTQGQKVVSNTFPPRFAMEYAADGIFSTITARVDNGSQQLIVNPSGVPTNLQTALGEHELTVIGNLNEFSTAKRISFELGAKNVSAGAGSIDYTTSNCDANFNCDVNVILKVRNTGTFDIDEAFDLRLDHVGIGGGSQTLVQQAGPLEVGATTELVLPVLRASLGDTFSLTIDPEAALSDEYVADNSHQAPFLPGRITLTESALHAKNVYFEGVSVLNVVSVTTLGAVDTVQFSASNVDFVDDDASDGFAVVADMGLLTTENPCGQLTAFNSAGTLLDSRSLCYKISTIEVKGLSNELLPWSEFGTVVNSRNRVLMADVDMADLLLSNTESSLAKLSQPVSLHSSVRKSGKVVYRMLTDASSANNRPATQRVDLDGFPFFGDEMELPGGRSVFITSINSANGVCSVEGAIPLFKQSVRQNIEELYADELEEIREGTLTREELITSLIFGGSDGVIPPGVGDPMNLWLAEYANLLTEYGLPIIPPVHQDIADAFLNFEWILTGLARLKLPDKIFEVNVSGSRTTGFDSNGCLLVDKDGVTDIVFDGNYEDRIRLNVNPRTGRIEFNLLGFGSLGLADVPLPLIGDFDIPLLPLFLINVDLDIYPISINIPTSLGYKVGLSVVGEDVFLGPLHIAFNTRINHYQKVAELDGIGYLLGVLGYGYEFKAHLTIDAEAKLDLIPTIEDASLFLGAPTIDQLSSIDGAFAYKHQDVYFEVKKRKKACLGPFCKKRDWRIDSETTTRETETEGDNYSRQQVANFLASVEPLDLGSIEDLVGLVAYYDLIDRDDLGEDIVKCSVLQAFAKNMNNTPIYTNHGGSCRLVTEPDQGDTGQQYFANATCQTALPFKPTTFLNYCTSALTPTRDYVGNAAAWTSDGGPAYASLGRNTQWSLAHGPTLNFWALPPEGRRPFIKKAEYKSINGCQLEMRIYKQDIFATNLKPLMFIHGGSFKYRGFGTLGMESAISHFTERGYVVFAPYYRLMDDRDGPAACQNFEGADIVADIEDALEWVQQHGPTVGSSGSDVTLVGQSAGSHLAGWLATHPTLAADVRNMLLFYAPADLKFLVEESDTGGLYQNSFDVAKGLVADFFGVGDISNINLADPFVIRNGFPGVIAGGLPTAPAFMIHGNNDTLVPVEMSMRMCDAKAGNAFGTTPDNGGVYNCGADNSRLHIIEDAEHILDLRCFPESVYSNVFSLLDGDADELSLPCPSGILGASQVRTAIGSGLNWLN